MSSGPGGFQQGGFQQKTPGGHRSQKASHGFSGFQSQDHSSGSDDDVHFMGQSNHGFTGMPRRTPTKVPPVQVDMPVSLEDIYHGKKKRLKISRKRVHPSQPNTVYEDSKIVEVNIQPGWKAGTKITFEGEGNELPNKLAGDVTFVVTDKPHDRFKREGANLIYTHPCSLKDARLGPMFTIQGLDGRPVRVDCSKKAVSPDYVERLDGMGLPDRSSGGRGDMLMSFDIRFARTPLSGGSKRKLADVNGL
eukprot:g42934.t1